MKKVLLLITLFTVCTFAANAQSGATEKIKTENIKVEMAKDKPAVPGEGSKMTFESLNVDFGTIEKDSEPFRYAKFTNTGTEPLIIKNARGSCGCTVPTWPREAIQPGETGEIKIRYATNRIGKINKTVKLTTNEPAGTKQIVLRVIGKVLKPTADASVPAAKKNMITKTKK